MDPTQAAEWLRDVNEVYGRLHASRAEALWSAFMGLGDDPDADHADFERLEVELQDFLQEPARSAAARAAVAAVRAGRAAPTGLVASLEGWRRTFAAHAIDDPEARTLAADIVEAEGRLGRARAGMDLAYRVDGAAPVPASAVALGVIIDSDDDPDRRRAAWQALRAVEAHVLDNGFLEVVRMRNRLGRELGAEDYYDWKVRRTEGMSKREVFALLDDLDERTRLAAERSHAELRAAHGARAGEPWNEPYLSSGDVTREQDPHFPFERSIDRWARSFARLGVTFDGAELVLDLVDREGKYENGFMSSAAVSWRDGEVRRTARAYLAANAIPTAVGAGARALRTLFHEGGHAAHFANIDMPAPCFAVEVAPTSVALAEMQAMFFDSLVEDADWLARYARTREGVPMPWSSIERGVRARQPFAARRLRARLAICYAERALYEIPDDELGAERALAEVRRAERRLTFLDEGSWRPALSVPHLLRDESSAYYHGYLLAQMAVHQAREHFLERDGHLVDNPRIGPELRDVCWRRGNALSFGEAVEALTGRPLSADALARHLTRSADDAVARARTTLERSRARDPVGGDVRLDCRVSVVHGREVVARLDDGDFDAFSDAFARWVEAGRSRVTAGGPAAG